MKAYTKNIRISPRKLNLVAAIVRGMPVETALAQLKFTPKKAAKIIYKTVASAAANAEHTQKALRRNLVISSLVVQKGITLKRGIPVSRGRWHGILKRYSHLTVELRDMSAASTTKRTTTTAAAKPATKHDVKPRANKKVRTTTKAKKSDKPLTTNE